MENNVYIFFKSAKTDMASDSMIIEVDGEKKGVIKSGEEFKIQLNNGNHTIEIYMYNKKKCYAKKEININKSDTYLTYAPPIVYTMKGKIAEVDQDKYMKKRKNDKLYEILALIIGIIVLLLILMLKK